MKWLTDKGPEVVRQIAAYAAVLYVCGFLAFRTSLNTLGIPSDLAEAVDQRYLIEGGKFILETVPGGLLGLGLGALVIRAAGWLGQTRRFNPFLRNLSRGLFSLLTLVLPIKAASLLLDTLPKKPLLLGLKIESTTKMGGADSYLVCAAIAVGALAFVWTVAQHPERFLLPGLVRNLGGVLGASVAILLPMSYGCLKGADVEQEFPIVRIEKKAGEAAPLRAFLLLATPKRIVTYRSRVITIDAADNVSSISLECHGKLTGDPGCPKAAPSPDGGRPSHESDGGQR